MASFVPPSSGGGAFPGEVASGPDFDAFFEARSAGLLTLIYDAMGVTQDLSAKNNDQSIDQTINARLFLAFVKVAANRCDSAQQGQHQHASGSRLPRPEHEEQRPRRQAYRRDREYQQSPAPRHRTATRQPGSRVG